MIKYFKNKDSVFAVYDGTDRVISMQSIGDSDGKSEQQAKEDLIKDVVSKFARFSLESMEPQKAEAVQKRIKQIEAALLSGDAHPELQSMYENHLFIHKLVNGLLEEEILFETI